MTAKKKTVAHHDDLKPDFPTFAEMTPAGMLLIEKVRGIGEHDLACVAKAAWVVAGYGASHIQHAPGPYGAAVAPPDYTEEKFADDLEAAINAGEGAKAGPKGAIGWAVLAKFAFELLMKWLAS